MERVSWDEYFLNFAKGAAMRATCPRKHVGAVIVVDKQVIATGYNGSPRGMPHCEEDGVGCDMVNGSCVRTIHAEMNALAQAAKRGARVEDAAIYSTASPCWSCFRVLVNAGIKSFIFAEEYRSGGRDDMNRISNVAAALNLRIHQMPGAEQAK